MGTALKAEDPGTSMEALPRGGDILEWDGGEVDEPVEGPGVRSSSSVTKEGREQEDPWNPFRAAADRAERPATVQLVQTRTGVVYPRSGRATRPAEHFAQKMPPQRRQWWRRRKRVKERLHSSHSVQLLSGFQLPTERGRDPTEAVAMLSSVVLLRSLVLSSCFGQKDGWLVKEVAGTGEGATFPFSVLLFLLVLSIKYRN
eukprot:Hpha_TRINITY_DN15888_c0_g1::TRINITY_DN15888_c0_g1_i1::g.188860::m.188860